MRTVKSVVIGECIKIAARSTEQKKGVTARQGGKKIFLKMEQKIP